MSYARYVVSVACVAALTGLAGCGGEEAPPPEAGAPETTAPPSPSAASADTCPNPTATVRSADELKSALWKARPGDSIRLAGGQYAGGMQLKRSGTADKPIVVCGTRAAVVDGGGPRNGYGFHLEGVSHVRLVGFTVQNAQKGVMADGVKHAVIQGLAVQNTGDEAIHLRRHSTDNVVSGNVISKTGLRKPKFGEGIYVGSAESNWCRQTGCRPDKSDRNKVIGNRIKAAAESVDIKEGTSSGLVKGNTFDGSAMTAEDKFTDSWVDVKGNDWVIEGNTGTASLKDGFQTHEIVKGWGTGNVFRGNTANLNKPGLGFSLEPVLDNKISCDNKVIGQAAELANTKCA